MLSRELVKEMVGVRVVVVEHNPAWAGMFEAEATELRRVLGEELIAIHHIGSTSVPGLRAKPIIDILPVVKDLAKVDQLSDEMIGLGYEPMGEFGIAGRRYFRKGGDERTHQVHVFQAGNDHEIIRHLAFRDYLRAHPKDAERYGELKARLAAQFPDDIESYMNGKDALVKELERKAVEWWGVIEAGSEQDAEYVHQRLREYNSKYITDGQDFNLVIRDRDGNIVGGVVATRDLDYLTIDYLWVDDRFRKSGYGTRLMQRIELLAREAGCKLIYLNTFGFQAPGFYERLGFEVFGELKDILDGHGQYFLMKKLE